MILIYSVLCDTVVTHYPDVLKAVQNLKVLKESSKLVWQDILSDKGKLLKSIAKVTEMSNMKPYCNEDLYF